jgi:hypothetical protein
MKETMNNLAWRTFTTAALITTMAAAGHAQSRVYREGSSWVEETSGDLATARSIRVHTDLGSVNVDGSGGNGVHYTIRKRVNASSEEQARRMFDSLRFTAVNRADQDVINGETRGEWHRGSVQIQIVTPRQLDAVRVATDGGDVSVAHVDGRVDVETGGGRVALDDVNNAAKISSGGGNVHVGTVGNTLDVRSGGGNVDVNSAGASAVVETGGGNVGVNTVRGDLRIETGGGNISVKTVGGGLRASTGGGTLDLGQVGGQVSAETGGGSIRLSAGGGVIAQTGAGAIQCYNIKRGLRATTGAGGITAQFIGARGDFSDSKLEAGMGDIIVYLPNDLGVNVIASIELANGHRIQSDFPGLKISREEGYGPGEASAEGSLNGGGPTLKLHTTAGNISLRRIQKLVSSDEDVMGNED